MPGLVWQQLWPVCKRSSKPSSRHPSIRARYRPGKVIDLITWDGRYTDQSRSYPLYAKHQSIGSGSDAAFLACWRYTTCCPTPISGNEREILRVSTVTSPGTNLRCLTPAKNSVPGELRRQGSLQRTQQGLAPPLASESGAYSLAKAATPSTVTCPSRINTFASCRRARYNAIKPWILLESGLLTTGSCLHARRSPPPPSASPLLSLVA